MTDRRSCTALPATIVELSGAGAVQCLQGLVSNDVVKAADDSLTYGALLTAKGLIITDCWIVRHRGRLLLAAELAARQGVLETLRKSLPPRLARATDSSEAWSRVWFFGGTAPAAPDEIIALPAPAGAWFSALALGPAPAVEAYLEGAVRTGWEIASREEVERHRILTGWPLLGAEIDEKTLIQEVRFDEHEGVSYDKGCYVGQETVARLHFRGHTNRSMRGLVWHGGGRPADARILHQGREVGRISSVLPEQDRSVALALIRREIEEGTEVVAGGSPATVVSLPFGT